MSQHTINTHPTGKTSGTAQRPGHDHAGQAMSFDLQAELARLRQEDRWHNSGRNSRTLFKEPNLRLVLLTLRAGMHIQEHHAAGRLAIQVLGGRLRLSVPGQAVELPAGHLLALDFAVDYDIQALEESAFLLTLAWSGATLEG